MNILKNENFFFASLKKANMSSVAKMKLQNTLL